MLRGSSFLLRKVNARFYIDILQAAVRQPHEIWNLDVDSYTDQSIEIILDAYNDISNAFPHSRDTTLTTKIMLGIYGNVPAFDTYVTLTYRKIFAGYCGFRALNMKSLRCLKSFYEDHRDIIESFKNGTYCYRFDGTFSQATYTRAKLLDMLAFQHGIENNR